MTGRSRQILSRLPAHLDATRPGKVLESVVDAVSRDLDVTSAALARVRRSHRVGDAEELRDLLLIAARHSITLGELEPLFARFGRSKALLAELESASNADERDARAEALCELWGLADPAPRLVLFAEPVQDPETPNLDAARIRLIDYAGRALLYDKLLDAVRGRIRGVAAIHASGNGTIRALLEGASNVLSMTMGDLYHSEDRFWHAAIVKDRIALEHSKWNPDPSGGPAVESAEVLPPAEEVIGMEENPVVRAESDPKLRRNAELFYLLRVGFERVVLEVRVTGEGDRTVGPMVVNRDEGHGIGYAATVPASQMLIFTEEGRAMLGSSDVTAYAYAWQGACFANEGDSLNRSFLFAENGADEFRAATFAVSTPPDALNAGFVFPHAGAGIPMPGIAVGETRFAFFVQEGFFSMLGGTTGSAGSAGSEEQPVLRHVQPRPAVAFLDGSVFAPAPGELGQPSAMLSFSWLEQQPFAVRLLLPERFRLMHENDTEGVETLRRVAQGLNRFRPAGVELRVEYADDRWVLGQGSLTLGAGDDPIARLRSGTVLWTAPEEDNV